MTLEFDANGKIILPGAIMQDKEKERKSIILEKYQVKLNNPAIAQLKIKIGENLNADKEFLIKKIYSFCENFIKSKSANVESNLKAIGGVIIVEAKSSMMMYSFLEGLIIDIKEMYGKYSDSMDKYEIVVKGSWGKV